MARKNQARCAVRLLLADSLLIFRAGLRAAWAGEPEVEVLEAADADGLCAVAVSAVPDVALIDLHLPPAGGLDALRRLREVASTPAVVWSFEPTPDVVVAAVRTGACGYLRKEIEPAGLLRAVRGVGRGEAPLPHDLTAALVAEVQLLARLAELRERASALSSRELEVLSLLGTGASNRDIARRLYLSEFTVKRHVQNVLRKLGVRSRRDAAAFHEAADLRP